MLLVEYWVREYLHDWLIFPRKLFPNNAFGFFSAAVMWFIFSVWSQNVNMKYETVIFDC